MIAVSESLLQLLIELQSIPSLNDFYLAGGTSLAIRYNHRKSQDIDLFSDKCVGVAGLEDLQGELRSYFKNRILFCNVVNAELGDQYCFLRALISKNDDHVKVEILQNFPRMHPTEIIDDIKMMSIEDVGLLKLMSAGNRMAKKDIYDLDIITDNIPLEDLLNSLQEKRRKYSLEKDKSLFDLDDEISPTENIGILLSFDNKTYQSNHSRPSHSNDMIDLMEGSKNWRVARSSWLKKVKSVINKSV